MQRFLTNHSGKLVWFFVTLLLLTALGLTGFFAPALFGIALKGFAITIVDQQVFTIAASIAGSLVLTVPLLAGYIARKLVNRILEARYAWLIRKPAAIPSASEAQTPAPKRPSVFASLGAAISGLFQSSATQIKTLRAEIDTLKTQLTAQQAETQTKHAELLKARQEAVQTKQRASQLLSQTSQPAPDVDTATLKQALSAADAVEIAALRRTRDEQGEQIRLLTEELTTLRQLAAQLTLDNPAAASSSSSSTSAPSAPPTQAVTPLRSISELGIDDWRYLNTLFNTENSSTSLIAVRDTLSSLFTQLVENEDSDLSALKATSAVAGHFFQQHLSTLQDKGLFNLDKCVRIPVKFASPIKREYVLNEFIEELKARYVIVSRLLVKPNLSQVLTAAASNPNGYSIEALNTTIYEKSPLAAEQADVAQTVMEKLVAARSFLSRIHQLTSSQRKAPTDAEYLQVTVNHQAASVLFFEVKELLLAHELTQLRDPIFIPLFDHHQMPYSLQSFCEHILAELSLWDSNLEAISKAKPQFATAGDFNPNCLETAPTSGHQTLTFDAKQHQQVKGDNEYPQLTQTTGLSRIAMLSSQPGAHPSAVCSVTKKLLPNRPTQRSLVSVLGDRGNRRASVSPPPGDEPLSSARSTFTTAGTGEFVVAAVVKK